MRRTRRMSAATISWWRPTPQLVVLAAPVLANIRLLSELPEHVPGDAVVTDVGSTKRETMAAARALPERLTIRRRSSAGGRRGRGRRSGARGSVRRPAVDSHAIERSDAAATAQSPRVGVRRSAWRARPSHDAGRARLARRVSQPPAAARRQRADAPGGRARPAPRGSRLRDAGLRDTTRLASSPPDIWRDISRQQRRQHRARASTSWWRFCSSSSRTAGAAPTRLQRDVRLRRALEACARRGLRLDERTPLKASTRRTWRCATRPTLSRAPLPDAACRVERVLDCPPAFWRFLYTEVGRAHHWVDRLPWSPNEIRAYLADPAVTLWLMTVWGAPAGYFELRSDADGSIEIAYFGLLGTSLGRGLGGHLLTQAVQRAWEAGAHRACGCTRARSIIPPRFRTT